MERSERIGTTVSAAGHASLVAWALFGGIFFRPEPLPEPVSMTVGTISSSEFDALAAASPKAVTEAPVVPAAPPDTAEPQPAAQTEPPPDTLPTEPQAEPLPDAAPDVTDLAPPATEVTDAPPTEPVPPVTEPSVATMQIVNTKPKPRPAPRVAPVPADQPAPDAQVAEQVVQETTQAPTDQPLDQPIQDAAAPQEAGEVLQTEENRDQTEFASSAPLTASRPKSRPEKPAPAVETQVAAAPDAPAEDTSAAVNDALEQALAGEASETPAAGEGTAANGPPMTSGEKDALRVAVQRCWNQGAISTDATRVVLTVRVQMSPDGRPGKMELVSSEGGDDTATQIAYRTARSAISRCTNNGYPLPPDKYERWKVIDMIFDNQEGVR